MKYYHWLILAVFLPLCIVWATPPPIGTTTTTRDRGYVKYSTAHKDDWATMRGKLDASTFNAYTSIDRVTNAQFSAYTSIDRSGGGGDISNARFAAYSSGQAAINAAQDSNINARLATSTAAATYKTIAGFNDYSAAQHAKRVAHNSADDHAQYHNDTRGDSRYVQLSYTSAGNGRPTSDGVAAGYAPITKGVTNGNTHDHSDGDGSQIAYSGLSGLPTLGDSASLNVGTTADTVAAGNDSRFTDARTPLSHASTHVGGSDPIANATSGAAGLMSATDKTNLTSLVNAGQVTISAKALGAAGLGSWVSLQSAGYTLDSAKAKWTNIASQITDITTQGVDWCAIQEAVKRIESAGGKVLLDKGAYIVEAPIVIATLGGIEIEGVGRTNTYVTSKTGSDIVVFDVQEVGTYGQKGPKFSRFTISSVPTSYSVTAQSDLKSIGIRIGSDTESSPMCDAAADDRLINNVTIEEMDFEWLQKGIKLNTAVYANIHNNYFFINNYAFDIHGNACADWGDNFIYNNTIQGAHLDNGFSAITEAGVYQDGAGGTRFFNNKVLASAYGFKYVGKNAPGTSVLMLVGNSFEQQRTTSVSIDGNNVGLNNVQITANEMAQIGGSGVTAINLKYVNYNSIISGNVIYEYDVLNTGVIRIDLCQNINISGNILNGKLNVGQDAAMHITNSEFICYAANTITDYATFYGTTPTNNCPTGSVSSITAGTGLTGGTITTTGTIGVNVGHLASQIPQFDVNGNLGVNIASPKNSKIHVANSVGGGSQVTSSTEYDSASNRAGSGGGYAAYHNDAANVNCTSSGTPYACCTGSGTGTCTVSLPKAGNRLGYFLFGAYNTGGISPINAAGFGGYAEADWTDSSAPTYFVIQTAPSGSTARVERVRVKGNGVVKFTPIAQPSSCEEGDTYVDSTSKKMRTCTVAGTPGTWSDHY